MKLFFSLFISISVLAQLPSWVSNASKGCKKGYLCAVGEGVSQTMASAQARAALAKIFENKVTSSFKSDLSSSNGEVNDSASESITELTDMVIEGIEISKVAESNTGYYALAELNKRKAGVGFEKKIRSIDDKITSLLTEKEPAAALRAEQLFASRADLNGRHFFLTNRDIHPPHSLADILKAKKSLVKGIVLSVNLKEAGKNSVQKILMRELSEIGYKFSKPKSATHLISGEVTTEKMHLSVEGFEKYKFQISINSENNKHEKVGTIMFEVIETGRSFDQAYNNALPKISEEFKTNLRKLSIK